MGKKKRKGSRKKSTWRLAKGALYAGAIAAPGIARYQASGGGLPGFEAAMKNYAFVNESTNGFDMASGAAMWTPVAVLAAMDVVTSKIGLQRRIARGLSGIGI